ncbi:MAG: HAD-IA family hydrolase [Actinomycetota bacterium]|nr:HAD-IA family hydrolase [Actinomycetota bacterium]
MPSALLFDVGDVLLESNWVVLDELERRTGRRFAGRGAMDPAGDQAWQRCLDGAIDIDEYWNQLAQSGGYADRITMWRAMSNELGGGVFATDALALVDEARAAGIKVGILSNDLYRSSTREWVAGRPEFARFDVLVDCTDFGERKPAPGPYLKAAADFGLAPEQIVFLDDTPYCIEGARAVGMIAVHVDPLARSHGFERARRLVGLAPPTTADQLVAAAEVAYRSQDLTQIMPLLHPDIVVYWNGEKVAEGLDAAKQFHVQRLGFGSTTRHEYQLHKTLRAADGDTICVEWESSYRTDDGQLVRGRAGEFWTMRYGLLIEWRAYHHRLTDEGSSR